MNDGLVYVSPSGASLIARPDRGAKISSLLDPAGREWLTTSDVGAPAAGTPFGDAEMAGWDECAPTIAACVVNGRALPDHGDAWDATWSAGPDRMLAIDGSSLPYRLERRIGATDAGGIRLGYRATSLSGSIPFLWAAHPQFVAAPGTRIVLPPEVTAVAESTAPYAPVPWPAGGMSIDDYAPGQSRKLFALPEHRLTEARLVRADGAALRLSWSPSVHHLGLWFDNGVWSQQPVIAIEPTLGFSDSLADADAAGRTAVLIEGSWLDWFVDIDFEDIDFAETR